MCGEIVAGHFCEKIPRNTERRILRKASYDEVIRMMELMGIEGEYPVALGASKGMEDEQTPVESDGRQIYYRRSFESG